MRLASCGNALKIIKPPQRPNRDQNGIAKMALSVGCALAYNYFSPEPNDDFSGITAGTPRTFGDIIGSVLSRLGIPQNVNVDNYQINYPLPKLDGNWLDFCGQLADNAGWYLRCDTDGIVVSEYIANAGASGITYRIGTDDSDWTAIGDVGETPVEKLIVTGVKKTLDPTNTAPQIVYEYKTYSEIAPDLPVSQQNPFILTISKKTTTTNLKTATTTFSVETILEPYAMIAPDLPVSQQNPFILTISKKTIQLWTKIGDQKYRETFTEYKPYATISPNLPVSQQNPFVLTISNQKVTNGESAPPTDQPISDFNLIEEQVKSEIYAAQ